MISKEEAKNIINALLERFDYHLEEYKKGSYNETQTRNDYINPFFEALGWDINNKQGLAESYREVIHEDKIKIGGQTKAPDYCFTIYGQRKFFVEAKKPSVSIKDSIDPAYQLRRYGWSAKMPISIITDFEEFSIYDCTIKPAPMDRASVARIKYITFKDYLNEFDFIWDTFSKEMILKGSFDKFVSSDKGKKGTADVDAEFLKSLDSWRDLLARNIVNRNKDIDEDTLNFSLQKIMDRLIFLRISEDRGIELENTLLDTIGTSIYDKLKNIFISSEQKYNSSLFDFKKDQITRNLNIDDRVLKTIIEEMYYPKCPYEFSVIPVEILGHSYEQYLGKVIRITPGHILKIETKPEVRKAGGVYYTPQYIVDYIVKNTVGKLLGGWELGIGNLELGNELNQNIGLDYETESKDLQGVAGLGRGDEISRDDLHNNENSSETGNVWANQPNTESSSFNTSEYSGGLGKKLEKGAEKVLPNCERVGVGTRNASDFNSETGFDKQSGHASNLEKTSNSKQTFERNDSLIKQSQFLIPNSRQLTPDEVSKIKICDPACGSGSFLLGAYQYLLDWHKDYYTKQGKKSKGGKDSPLTPLGELTTNEKKRILLNNIYGVDLDSNAVEVSKLSLLLKCMEGETKETIETQIKLFHERVLPSLDNNIKSGNSLIDMDFYDSQIDFEPEVEKKIKPFNWESAFPEVFGKRESGGGNREAGFDVVIGNPPYVKEYTSRETFEQIKKSHLIKYYQGKMDLWYFFVCHGIDLLKPNGLLGYIVPNNWVTNYGASILRNKIISDSKINAMIDFQSFMVFQDASIQTMILLLEKNNTEEIYNFENIKVTDNSIQVNEIEELLNLKQSNKAKILYPEINRNNYYNKFLIFESKLIENVLNKIKNNSGFYLNEKEVANGIHPHFDFVNKKIATKHNNVFKIGDGIFGLTTFELNNLNLTEIEKELIKPYYNSSDKIKRYFIDSKSDLWLIYTNSEFKNPKKIEPFTNIKKHLDKFKNVITSDNKPYGLHRAREERFFKGEKIISIRKCANKPIFVYADFDTYVSATFYVIKSDRINLKYLTGILNSKVVEFWLRKKGKMQGTNFQIDKEPLLQIPIPDSRFPNPDSQLTKLVETMLQLNKDLQNATLPEHKEQLQSRISYTDKKIDSLVYQLYNLTEEEIKIVEGE